MHPLFNGHIYVLHIDKNPANKLTGVGMWTPKVQTCNLYQVLKNVFEIFVKYTHNVYKFQSCR